MDRRSRSQRPRPARAEATNCGSASRRWTQSQRCSLATAPVRQAHVQCLDRQTAFSRELPRPTLQQQWIANTERPLRRDGDLVLAAQVQFSGLQVEQAEPPQGHQQVKAGVAVKARQRQTLEHALEASLGTPRRLAAEGDGLRARAGGPGTVGGQRGGAPPGLVHGTRPECDVVELGQLGRGPRPAYRGDGPERIVALQRAQIGDQKAQPAQLLEVVLSRGELGIKAGWVLDEPLQSSGREGELVGQTLGIRP